MLRNRTGIPRGFACGCALLLAARAVFPSPAITQYLIVSGTSTSGSWNSAGGPRLEAWRAQYGEHFAWFRQDGRDYIVIDSQTLAEIDRAMAPQREVNLRQDEVNRRQAEVNRLQDGVNGRQSEVNRAQAEVNRQQSLVNGGAGSQSRVNQMQSDVNGKQRLVNAGQDRVNERQTLVNRAQDGVNRLQTRASDEIGRALQSIFDSARRQGLAREAR